MLDIGFFIHVNENKDKYIKEFSFYTKLVSQEHFRVEHVKFKKFNNRTN